ncbi:MAG: N-acetyl-gamma-glutamyl-phosphate reductase [Actinobacteria bacterium]|nr:N-acetyl-gamma-glutamyl-phosphate reductase [Actinomycetota bacterium]
MGFTVAVAGASGYAGGELLRLIAAHPEFTLGTVTAASNAGSSVTSVHPQLIGVVDGVFAPTTADSLRDVDLVFTALPHGESASLVAHLPAELPVVDLGADFRLTSGAAWTRYYGGSHAGTWEYGLPELPDRRAAIAASHRIANPGCYATSVALGLAPLLNAGLTEPSDIVVVAASGTSGAGRKASESLLGSEVMNSMTTYKTGGAHQHTPEMEQSLSSVCGETVSLSFTPMLAPMPRGILATCTARVQDGVSADDVRAAMHAAYADESFVHLLPEGMWPRTADTLGSNSAHVQVALDSHAGRVIVVVALDNLVKGAAGQAVQNANLVLGLPEPMGLPSGGVAP